LLCKTETMQKLTNKEEEVMLVLWRLERAFVKQVLAELPDDNHYNTVSTIIRNLEDKGFVGHEAFGNTYQYYPLIQREAYRKKFMKTALASYFDNSYKNLVSYFVEEAKISEAEWQEIKEMIRKKGE